MIRYVMLLGLLLANLIPVSVASAATCSVTASIQVLDPNTAQATFISHDNCETDVTFAGYYVPGKILLLTNQVPIPGSPVHAHLKGYQIVSLNLPLIDGCYLQYDANLGWLTGAPPDIQDLASMVINGRDCTIVTTPTVVPPTTTPTSTPTATNTPTMTPATATTTVIPPTSTTVPPTVVVSTPTIVTQVITPQVPGQPNHDNRPFMCHYEPSVGFALKVRSNNLDEDLAKPGNSKLGDDKLCTKPATPTSIPHVVTLQTPIPTLVTVTPTPTDAPTMNPTEVPVPTIVNTPAPVIGTAVCITHDEGGAEIDCVPTPTPDVPHPFILPKTGDPNADGSACLTATEEWWDMIGQYICQ